MLNIKHITICWMILGVILGIGVGVTPRFLPKAVAATNDATLKSDQARIALESSLNEVLAIIQDETLIANPGKQERVLYEKAFKIFDFNTFSMLSLGRKYREFSPVQRKEFISLFSKFISNTYFPKLAGQNVSDIKIIFNDVRSLTPRKGIYRTDIATEIVHGETHANVVYRMIQKKELGWKIYDIKVEGVSMAANYREQFKQDLSLTPEKIIARLKEKVEK